VKGKTALKGVMFGGRKEVFRTGRGFELIPPGSFFGGQFETGKRKRRCRRDEIKTKSAEKGLPTHGKKAFHLEK